MRSRFLDALSLAMQMDNECCVSFCSKRVQLLCSLSLGQMSCLTGENAFDMFMEVKCNGIHSEWVHHIKSFLILLASILLKTFMSRIEMY